MSAVVVVQESEVLTRSALEAARTVLKAPYCAVAWLSGDVVATQGISAVRAQRLAPRWIAAALGHGSRASQVHRVEPVLGPEGEVRGALVADLRGGVRPGDARALMPVFAAHLALLAEKVEVQARRTASYEALVQIGMQIQAAEADVDAALELIVARARELLGTDLAWMGLVNPDGGTLDMRVAVGARSEPFMQMQLALGEGVGGTVVATRRPLAVPDYAAVRPRTPGRVRDAILGEGIGSMLCCPMLSGEKVVGALYVGSRHPREFPPIDVALTSALAAQGAVAIENGRLYAALAEQNSLLEGSFAVHRALTDAALTGAGRAHICTELARLIGAGVVLEQEISPPHLERFGSGEPGVSIPVEDVGRLSACLTTLTPLQAKALEHAATVLALELVKERAEQQVAWQLQGDLLSELLDAGSPLSASLAARARRHGIDLTRPHRILAVHSPQAVPDDLLALVRRATGRGLRDRDAALVCVRGEHVILAARDGDDTEAIRAITAAAARAALTVALGVSDTYAGAAPSPLVPAAQAARAGARGPHPALPAERRASPAPNRGADLASAYRQAIACARLALSRGDGVVRADRLGPLRFLLDAPDVGQVRAVVAEQLGLARRARRAGRSAGHAEGLRGRRRERRRDREGLFRPQEHAPVPAQAARRGARPRPGRARCEVPSADGLRPRRSVRRHGHRRAAYGVVVDSVNVNVFV